MISWSNDTAGELIGTAVAIGALAIMTSSSGSSANLSVRGPSMALTYDVHMSHFYPHLKFHSHSIIYK